MYTDTIIRSTSILALEAIRPEPLSIPIEYKLKSAPPVDTMTDDDIRAILQDKRKELTRPVRGPIELTECKSISMGQILWQCCGEWWYGWSVDDLAKLIYSVAEERQNGPIRTCIRRLEYELRQRHNPTLKNTKEDLDRKKQEVAIRDVVERYVTLPHRARPGSLIPCCMPDHQDKSPSLMIYDKTNSWKCFGCSKWGSAIDFIMGFEQCTLAEAIKKFLQF